MVYDMTFDLKDMRTQYGLSQIQLADLMGITQSTVSRWEKGLEVIRHSRRMELLDLFSNRNGKLDPIVKRLAAKNPNLACFDFNYNCLAAAQFYSEHIKVDEIDIIGNNYEHILNSDWCTDVYENVPLEERLYYEYERTVDLATETNAGPLSYRVSQYYMQFEDGPGLMVSLPRQIPPVGNPRVFRKLTLETLDSGSMNCCPSMDRQTRDG